MWIVRNLKKANRHLHLPIFCKQFQIEKPIEKCLLEISALGIFHIRINDQDINDYFMPGWTNYNRYVHLCSYDLTKFLRKENTVEITLADGWYCGRLGYTMKSEVYGEIPALFAKVQLFYKDGSSSVIETDESWRVGKSKILSSSFLDGETVDFTLPCFSIQNLPFAKTYDCQIPFEKYAYEPVKRIAEWKPSILQKNENKILIDTKQNFAGFLSFFAEGERGAEIIVKYAEILNEDGTPYYDNLRSAKATDRLILSGGKDFFEPRFTLHGFRYAEIQIKGSAKLYGFKAVALSQGIEYHGKFACSDKIVNQIYKNVLWGQKSNFISIPTDCPQRDERLGWTGDAEVFCNSAMFNGQCKEFFNNYLKLIRTDVLPDGKIPSLVPFFISVSASTAGVPAWADAICVIPYYHYLHYRDKQVIADSLPAAVGHINYYLSKSENFLLRVNNTFGDWLSVERADDRDVISQCFFGLSSLLLSKMFAIVEDRENEKKYDDLYENVKAAFRKRYLLDRGYIVGDSQTVYALSLAVGFVSADEIRVPFLESIERAGGKLTTGFVGVKYLLPSLCEIGATDLAYKIIKETEYPSWGYTILNGATTIWERWNGYTKEKGFETPSMNSFNHYSLGSCAEWLYSHVLGIKLGLDGSICIAPSLSKELSFAKGEYKSVNGLISVSWKRIGDKFRVKVKTDPKVAFSYDFGEREILSVKSRKNMLCIVVK